MTSKRLKSIGVLFLSIIYIATSCLLNFSFAATDANANVSEGKYYIKNKNTTLYMGALDYYNVVLSSFQGGSETQMWQLEYVSEGYYRIKNLYTEKYLTAPSTLTEGSSVTEEALSSSNNAQLWNFTELESGQFAIYKEYKISAKTHENTDLALVNDNYLTSYGYSVVQDKYILDSIFYDEWY